MEQSKIETKETKAPEAMAVAAIQPVGSEQLKKFDMILQKYIAGKKPTDTRIIESENWWKLRNSIEEKKETEIGKDGGFKSVSGWLHNVIVSKHADAVEAYPEPNILPREKDDRGEAHKLSQIIPCVLEQNNFDETYSDAWWQKCKSGTGVYKITWDSGKLNGLGDISIENVSLLNLFWEPGVTDIQKSRYFFHVEHEEKDILEQRYPQLEGKLKGKSVITSEFQTDDTVDNSNKVAVIDVYYHKYVNGKKTLQYCKYVNDQVLFATENETKTVTDEMGRTVKPSMAERGLYDHGLYPYEFDTLFPVEGSPCGYGYIDICKNPQTEIDLLKTSFVKNAMVGAIPRYFKRQGSGINEQQFLDLSKPLVDVTGSMDENAVRRIDFVPLDPVYVNMLDRTIQELRETSGNTETSTGNISSGVTAASAIAALQEASGKGSRDSTNSAYRSFARIVNQVIELIRQFYDMPRQFRIVGQYGMEQFAQYTNAGIQPIHQGNDFGQDMGYRLPVFDIKVSAQKKNVYTKVTQNELALQFFQLGFFNPQMVDQALMTLDLMEFDGKDTVMQKVAQNGTMFQKLIQYMQLALVLTQQVRPDMVQGISQDIMQIMGGGAATAAGGAAGQMFQSDHIAGIGKKEPAQVENARAKSGQAAQPDGDAATRRAKKND